MRNKFTILIIIILISGVLAVGSFMMLDRENFVDKYEVFFKNPMDHSMRWGNWYKEKDLKHSLDLEKFNIVEIDTINYALVVQKGPEKIEVYSDGRNFNPDIIKDIYVKDGVLKMPKLNLSENFTITIYSEDWQNTRVQVEDVNGVLSVDSKLKDLKAENINGVLMVTSPETFDIDIESVNGVLSLNFEEKNVQLTIDELNSVSSIFGRKSIEFGSEGYEIIKGEGRDKINIGNINGVANIE